MSRGNTIPYHQGMLFPTIKAYYSLPLRYTIPYHRGILFHPPSQYYLTRRKNTITPTAKIVEFSLQHNGVNFTP